MPTTETELQQQAYDRLADEYAQTYAEPRTRVPFPFMIILDLVKTT
jgi:hypothetical protein